MELRAHRSIRLPAVLLALAFASVASPAGAASLCSAGSSDGQACTTDVDCPGGACTMLHGVCVGGDEDGFSCSCPGGVCAAEPACGGLPTAGTCVGGTSAGQCCDISSNCASNAPCTGTQKVCVGGSDQGLPCVEDAQCCIIGVPLCSAQCLSTGRVCRGGDFDGFSCVGDADCAHGNGVCVGNPLGVTPTPVSGECTGDCSGNRQVTVDELLTMVNIALGNALVTTCMAGDANHDNQITIDEILAAVSYALSSCPTAVATATPTSTSTAGPSTATPTETSTPNATSTSTETAGAPPMSPTPTAPEATVTPSATLTSPSPTTTEVAATPTATVTPPLEATATATETTPAPTATEVSSTSTPTTNASATETPVSPPATETSTAALATTTPTSAPPTATPPPATETPPAADTATETPVPPTPTDTVALPPATSTETPIVAATATSPAGTPTAATPSPTISSVTVASRAAGSANTVVQTLRGVAALFSSFTQLATALAGNIFLQAEVSAPIGVTPTPSPTPMSCSGGGTRTLECTQMVSSRSYTLSFVDCTVSGAAGGTAVINGTLTAESGPGLCINTIPPTSLTNVKTSDLDVTVKDMHGMTTFDAMFDVTGSATATLGGSCFISGFDLTLDGTVTVTAGGLSPTIKFDATDIALNVSTYSADCVPTMYDMTVNGALTLNGTFVGTFKDFVFSDNSTSGDDVVRVNGKVDSMCFGTEVTYITAQQDALTIPSGTACPTSGSFQVMTGNETDRVSYSPGTVNVDFGDNGSVEHSYSGCADPFLDQCP